MCVCVCVCVAALNCAALRALSPNLFVGRGMHGPKGGCRRRGGGRVGWVWCAGGICGRDVFFFTGYGVGAARSAAQRWTVPPLPSLPIFSWVAGCTVQREAVGDEAAGGMWVGVVCWGNLRAVVRQPQKK